jgi:hypothetical protein
MTAAQVRDLVRREIDQWATVVKAAHIQPP